MTPAELFDRAGRVLFGEQYVAPIAALLNVHKNTVGKWRDGKSRIPSNVFNELAQHIHNRRALDLQATEEALFALADESKKPRRVVSRNLNDAPHPAVPRSYRP